MCSTRKHIHLRRFKEIVISNWPSADTFPCGAQRAYSLRVQYSPSVAHTPVPAIQADRCVRGCSFTPITL
jgi:hypothetical protein